MKTTRKSKINENALRSMLRKEISKLLEVDGVDDKQPEPEPEPEEEEQGLDPKLQAITGGYIRKLKDSGAQVGTEELVEMLTSVIERFIE